MDRFGNEENSVASQEKELREYCEDLEERYNKKREELEREEAALRERIKREIGEEEFGSFDVERRERELREQTETVERSIAKEETAIRQIEFNIDKLPERAEREETNYRDKIIGLEKHEERACEELRQSIAGLPNRNEETRRNLESRQQEEDSDIADKIKNRDGNGISELSGAIKGILENWRLLNNYKNEFNIAKRYNKAYQCFKEGRYKNWNDFRRVHDVDGSK
jgi:hypothetical protein